MNFLIEGALYCGACYAIGCIAVYLTGGIV
jgi:hypothetical protein